MSQTSKTLSIGYHREKVTPPMGMRVPGYYEVRRSDGIINDLYIRATAFSDGKNKAILFSCDAISIRSENAQEVTRMIAQRCGISPDAVYITCTHSHTAFRIAPMGHKDTNPVFLRRLYQQFVDCAQFAFEDLKPATLKVASGAAPGVGFIRRYRMKDGSCRTNPGIGNPDIVGPADVQDDSVQLIRAIRDGGSEILFVNFGTHADVVSGTRYCSDWPGFLGETLKGAMDHETEVMVLVGCEGDSNHVDVFQPAGSPLYSIHIAKRMARILAGEVLRIYDSAREIPGNKVTFAKKLAKIGKNPHDPADEPEALEVNRIYQTEGIEAAERARVRLNVPEAVRIAANIGRPEFFELQLTALQLGNVAFVGLPGEPFVEIGRQIKAGSHMDMTFVTCITNGGQGYFPTEAAFAERGYERSASPFAHNCAQILIDAGKQLLNGMERID